MSEQMNARKPYSHYPTFARWPTKTPHPLFDKVREIAGFNSDRAMAKALDLDFAKVSKERNNRRGVGDETLLAIHELLDIPFEELRRLASLPPPVRDPRPEPVFVERKKQVPHPLVDRLRAQFGVKSDHALARRLDIDPMTVSRIRHVSRVSTQTLVAIHEASDIPLEELRTMVDEADMRKSKKSKAVNEWWQKAGAPQQDVIAVPTPFPQQDIDDARLPYPATLKEVKDLFMTWWFSGMDDAQYFNDMMVLLKISNEEFHEARDKICKVSQ